MSRDQMQDDEAVLPPEQWLGFLLNQLGGRIRERTHEELRELGFAPNAFGLLLALRERPGSNQIELSRRLGVDRTTMSQLVDELVRKGLVERGPDPSNRRSNRLVLSKEGEQRVITAGQRALAVERSLTRSLSEEQLRALKANLSDLLNAVRAL